MIRGSCLCGGVRFGIERAVGPFELSHGTRCRKVSGSQLPDPSRIGEPWFEIPAGALDDDPVVRPDKHICVEFRAAWDRIADGLPQMTKKEIKASRKPA